MEGSCASFVEGIVGLIIISFLPGSRRPGSESVFWSCFSGESLLASDSDGTKGLGACCVSGNSTGRMLLFAGGELSKDKPGTRD